MNDDNQNRFNLPTYVIRKTFFKLFGQSFRIFDEQGALVFYSRLKAFKLKEDIRLYAGEDMQHELLTIKARQVLDFGATYDVVDPGSGEKVGALRRKALKSFIRDEWKILDAQNQEIGRIMEDSAFKAMIRRLWELIALLMPQKYHVEVNGRTVAQFQQNYNPLIQKIELNFSADAQGVLDRRLGLAAGVLLAAIEGRQT